MPRRRPEIESDDPNRWLVSYADFITLLFGFFVVMYAVSSVNEGKYRVVSESLVAAFRSPQKSLEPIQVGRLARSPYQEDVSIREMPTAVVPTGIPLLVKPIRIAGAEIVPGLGARKATEPESVAPDSAGSCPVVGVETAEITPLVSEEVRQFPVQPEVFPPVPAGVSATEGEQQTAAVEDFPLLEDQGRPAVVEASRPPVSAEAARIAETLSNAMPGLVEKGDVSIRFTPEAAEIEIASGLLFDSASAGMDTEALPILSHVAQALLALNNDIRVEGFTDNRPISTEIYPSNWELSAARAASVVHQFTRLGIDPQRMAATGYGEHRPVAPNDTPTGRKRNRRVLILVLAGSSRPSLAPVVEVPAVSTGTGYGQELQRGSRPFWTQDANS